MVLASRSANTRSLPAVPKARARASRCASIARRPALERALARTKACQPDTLPRRMSARLQEAVARLNQGVIALALAWGEPDGEAHHAMRERTVPDSAATEVR